MSDLEKEKFRQIGIDLINEYRVRGGLRPIDWLVIDTPEVSAFIRSIQLHEKTKQELQGVKQELADNKRQPTQSDAVRDLVATLWCASGCSCCRDDDAWEKASHELAELLGIPKYDDGSGYDWYSVCDTALEQSK